MKSGIKLVESPELVLIAACWISVIKLVLCVQTPDELEELDEELDELEEPEEEPPEEDPEEEPPEEEPEEEPPEEEPPEEEPEEEPLEDEEEEDILIGTPITKGDSEGTLAYIFLCTVSML